MKKGYTSAGFESFNFSHAISRHRQFFHEQKAAFESLRAQKKGFAM